MINEAVEKLKKANHEQFENLEPRIQKLIKEDKGVAELTQSFSKVNGEVAGLLEQVRKLEEERAASEDALQKRVDEFEAKYSPDNFQKNRGEAASTRILKAGFPDEAAHNKAHSNPTGIADIVLKDGSLPFLYGPTGRKLVSDSSGSADALSDSLRLPGVVEDPRDRLVVQALLPRITTQNRTVDYVRLLTRTDASDMVAESTTGSLQSKPEGDRTFQLVTITLRKIAEWIAVSTEALMFSNRIQLQSYLENDLRGDLLQTFETQILTGDGTGQNLTGLIPGATAYSRGYATIGGSAATAVDTLRRARTQLAIANYMASGVILHPADMEEIALLKDTQLAYIVAHPAASDVNRMWGIAMVESNKMTENEFLMGDFARAAELYVTGDITIKIGPQHASFFIQNVVAILAEFFAACAVKRALALVTGGLTNADS